MLMFELILVLLLAAVLLTVLAERVAVPYPSLLVIAGAGLAFLPSSIAPAGRLTDLMKLNAARLIPESWICIPSCRVSPLMPSCG
jgi:hypothetical protein